MTHTRMCQEYPVSLEKLSFFFIQVKIIQVLVFDNWHPLKSHNIAKYSRKIILSFDKRRLIDTQFMTNGS